jgi:hypothetical protein
MMVLPCDIPFMPNMRVEQCPEGASVRTPGSPRSGAEGESGVSCSTRAFPPERSGGGNVKASGGASAESAGVPGWAIDHDSNSLLGIPDWRMTD